MADNSELTRPIIGIENRTAQEVFDIMADRIRRTPVTAEAGEVSEAVTDQDVYDALHARAPGGAEVWLWLPQEADEPDNPHTARPNRTAYEVMRAALETLASRRVQPKQDAPSPDVAGLIEAEKKGIYIASKTKHAHRWRLLRDKIGYPITSTWIDEAGDGESKDLSDLWQRCIAEASSAEVVVVYREPGDTLKGAWIELGAALASGVPVFAVGIEEFTVAHDKRIRHFNSMAEAMKVLKPMVNGTRFVALSRLTTPEQDDARDSTQATDIIASLQYRLSVAYKAKAECNDEANRERHLRLAAEASLASARADGVREASKAANEVHEYYAGVRDKTPTGTPAHDVAQEGVIASAQTWRAVAALLPDQPAAIRALINDAGGK